MDWSSHHSFIGGLAHIIGSSQGHQIANRSLVRSAEWDSQDKEFGCFSRSFCQNGRFMWFGRFDFYPFFLRGTQTDSYIELTSYLYISACWTNTSPFNPYHMLPKHINSLHMLHVGRPYSVYLKYKTEQLDQPVLNFFIWAFQEAQLPTLHSVSKLTKKMVREEDIWQHTKWVISS